MPPPSGCARRSPGSTGTASTPASRSTVSAGVAVASADDTVEALLGRADMALYAAKHDGRNRVRSA